MRPRAIPIAEAVPRPRNLEDARVFPGSRPRLFAGAAAGTRRGWGWGAFGARRRKLVTGAVVATAIVVAGLAGALFGAGLYTVEGRFGAERMAAQAGQMELRGLPDVPGHPGARTDLNRMDVVRQVMALDGVQ